MDKPKDATDLLLEHYRQPHNWGSVPDKEVPQYLIGITKKEADNDFLALSFKWAMLPCPECSGTGKVPNSACGSSDIEFVNCSFCHTFGSYYYIESVRHVSVGCGWLIASSSWFSEYAECKRVEELMALKEEGLIKLSGLPWVAHHCAELIREATLDALNRGFKCLVSPA